MEQEVRETVALKRQEAPGCEPFLSSIGYAVRLPVIMTSYQPSEFASESAFVCVFVW